MLSRATIKWLLTALVAVTLLLLRLLLPILRGPCAAIGILFAARCSAARHKDFKFEAST